MIMMLDPWGFFNFNFRFAVPAPDRLQIFDNSQAKFSDILVKMPGQNQVISFPLALRQAP
jgi:hypothetical protein